MKLLHSIPILTFALAVAGWGQVHHIEMAFGGANCAPCLESMPARAKRIRGVESATVDTAKGVLTLQLAIPNRVRVEQIRDLIEQDGTKALRAVVEVSGVVEKGDDGVLLLRIPQHPTPMELKTSKTFEPGSTVKIHGAIEDLKRTPRLLLAVDPD